MKAKIKINGREVIIENIKRAEGIKKFTGLMFKSNSDALLFDMGKGRKAIHSLFCRPFIAVWMLEDKVVEYRVIDKWMFSITPASDFDRLLEIPITEKYAYITCLFT